MSNDTPRTDAAMQAVIPPDYGGPIYLADFARTLERENAQQAARIAYLEELRQGDFALVKALAEHLGIPITASDKSPGTQWEQFHEGCCAMKATIAQLTERLAMVEAERDKLACYYSEIVAAIGHDCILKEYNQRGELLCDESQRRKEAESQLATALAQLKEAEAKLVHGGSLELWEEDKHEISQLNIVLTDTKAALAAKTREMEEIAENLVWACNRLDHLRTVFEEGRMASEDFDGPNETMAAVLDRLPAIMERYKIEPAWPSGRFDKVSARSNGPT